MKRCIASACESFCEEYVMVSIKDIASACGVSIATVSKALNDHSDVSGSTKALVRDTAKKMGYLPNSQARALKTNRTYNLGVLFVERASRGLTHSHFSAVLNGFKNEAEANGYDITFINRNTGGNTMTYYEHCMFRGVDGVAVACVDDFEDEGVTELLNSSVPAVTIDYVGRGRPAVLSDNAQGMRALTEYICGMGHKRIAYICGDDSKVTSIRIESFCNTLKSLGIRLNSDHIVRGKYQDPETTEKLTKELVTLKEPPTCIIMPDDFSALGGITALEKLGMSVPEDISIAGYDGITLSRFLHPRLTTYQQDTEKIGAEAARQLIAMIRKEIPGEPPVVTVSGNLIKGSSVKYIGG